jgi:thiosulfate reductase cytochrome b subunit
VSGERPQPTKPQRIFRHALVVRLTHWINVLCLVILLMSGLQIFNAHPALYWGNDSNFDAPLASIVNGNASNGRPVGLTNIGTLSLETTGILGWSRFNGHPVARAFPAWATIPAGQDLPTGRTWHFFFAWLFLVNGLVYLAYSLATGHLWRDLLPTVGQLRTIPRTVLDHLRLRFDQTDRYNVLQRIAYLVVILLALPVMILAGLAMSPGMDAAAPWLVDLFGGRQSARTIHFVLAWLLVAFALVHVAMVILSGAWRNLVSMITGWYWPKPMRRSN